MKFISKIATSVGLTLALATVSLAQQVKTDYDHNANFGQYKTYSWEKVQTKDPLLVDQFQVRLMHDGGALQRVPRIFARHVPVRQTAQLIVDHGHQAIQRGLVALVPLDQQGGHVGA